MRGAATLTSWDEDLTELNLDLHDVRIDFTPEVATVCVELPVAPDADDLPMLDPCEFVLRPSPRASPLEKHKLWITVAPWVAFILTAWVFRVQIVRFLGLI